MIEILGVAATETVRSRFRTSALVDGRRLSDTAKLNQVMVEGKNELGIVPFWSVFRDKAKENAFQAFRRPEDVRAASLALLMGGLAYGVAGWTDSTVFEKFPGQLPLVRLLRVIGVVLCLGGAALIYRLRSTFSVHLFCALSMLGTLTTYSTIVFLEERLIGGSEYRAVFSVFALLAFIFFPIKVWLSLAMALFMLAQVSSLFLLANTRPLVELQRTLALMTTFGIAGASFSVTYNRARRMEFELRLKREETLQQLSKEVDARREVEAELERHQAHLQDLVSERTAALESSREQLVAAQRVEALGQLAGGLAHDFNNLLVTIMGSAELSLENEHLPHEVRQYQENIMDASERAARLARDLLAGSRKQVMDFDVLDPGSLVGSLERILETAVGKRTGLTIHREQTPAIIGARGPLEQVLLNLVVNARDAAEPEGTVEVRVETVHLDENDRALPPGFQAGTYVRLSVKDSGRGILPALRERVFEPFFSTKPETEGTGLGLSVVRGVVEQHGGFIDLQSELNRGTTFAVHLPACAERPTTRPLSGIREARGGHESILVVDDDPLVLRLLKRALEKAGYVVATAKSGADGLERLSQTTPPFDLVLSDLVMPHLGGRQLLEEARRRGFGSPFLFSSGYSDGGVHGGFVIEKGIHFLAKPYTTRELLQKVRQVLDLSTGGQREAANDA